MGDGTQAPRHHGTVGNKKAGAGGDPTKLPNDQPMQEMHVYSRVGGECI
jgi:hypothetical protein